jgi:D-threo-aldose 1-dehydrogenase
MRTRPLGRTGLLLTEIGLGAGPLGGFYGPISHLQAAETVRAAWDFGIRYFDVAPLYGHGRAELLLGHTLREYPREQFVLSTKVGRYFSPPADPTVAIRPGGLPFQSVLDYTRSGVMRSIEQSMMRLGMTRIDIVLIHDVDAHAQGSDEAAAAAYRVACEEAYPALVELKKSGDIKAIGIGLNQVSWALRWITDCDLDCVLIAGRYTLLNRDAETELFPECQRRGIGVLSAGPFNGGLLARGINQAEPRFNYRPAPQEVLDRLLQLQEWSRDTGTPLKKAAVRFALDHPAVTSVVAGAMSADEIAEICEAV